MHTALPNLQDPAELNEAEPSVPPGLNNCSDAPPAETAAHLTDGDGALTAGEAAALAECERHVRHLGQAGIDAGRALGVIRDRRLYRDAHPTFEGYVEATWDFGVRRAYQLADAAAVHDGLAGAGFDVLPANEAQARPLVGLADAERDDAWGRALDSGKVTAKAVHEAVVARGYGKDGEAVPPGPDAEDWPWGGAARDAFAKVPAVDRAAVRDALTLAALSEDVTAETVAEAAEVVASVRAEDGGTSSRPVVVGVAVGIVELNRRRLLYDDRPELIETIDYLPEEETHALAPGPYVPDGSEDEGAQNATSNPLLVVIPASLCPDALLEAHGAEALVEGRSEVIVEIGELERFGGPVSGGVLDVAAVREAARGAGIKKAFNPTGPLVGWARFTTNGSTGCSHACARRFCYASDLSLRFYSQAFVPTIWPARLDAFSNTPLPGLEGVDEWEGGWSRSTFYGSMSDVMNVSFPDWWIQAVIDEIAAHPSWRVFVLTKLAARLGDFEWPPNAMVGATVTRQGEVRAAARGLGRVQGAGATWVSAEPFLGPIDPAPLLDAGVSFFAVGGQSATRWSGEEQPRPAWVVDLFRSVWARGGHVYAKDNLDWRGHIPFGDHGPPIGNAPAEVGPEGARPAEVAGRAPDRPAVTDLPAAVERPAVPARGPVPRSARE